MLLMDAYIKTVTFFKRVITLFSFSSKNKKSKNKIHMLEGDIK